MLTFADANTTDVANGSSLSGILLLLLDGDRLRFWRATPSCCTPPPRPTVFLTWLIVPGIIVAWRRGEKLVAIQALALLLAAIGIDALGVRRGLKSEYFIFTDPADHPRGRDPARLPERPALSQMGLSPRRDPVRTAHRRRPGRAELNTPSSAAVRNRLPVAPVLSSAAAAAHGAPVLRPDHNGLLKERPQRPWAYKFESQTQEAR